MLCKKEKRKWKIIWNSNGLNYGSGAKASFKHNFPIWILHWKFCTLTIIFPLKESLETSQQKMSERESNLMLNCTCSQKTWMNVFLKTVRLHIKQIMWNDQINTPKFNCSKQIHVYTLSINQSHIRYWTYRTWSKQLQWTWTSQKASRVTIVTDLPNPQQTIMNINIIIMSSRFNI